jgi:hypothetical protein
VIVDLVSVTQCPLELIGIVEKKKESATKALSQPSGASTLTEYTN